MTSTKGKDKLDSQPEESTGLIATETLKLDNLGTAVKDLLPIPSDTTPVSDPAKEEVSHTLVDDPTLSHALATEDHEVTGLAQQDHDHDGEVLDLGWNQKKQEIAQPLVGGLDNEELWLLIRRFDKACQRKARC